MIRSLQNGMESTLNYGNSMEWYKINLIRSLQNGMEITLNYDNSMEWYRIL